MMNDPIGSILGLLALLTIIAVILMMVAGWELFELGWPWPVWRYGTEKPHIMQAWDRRQRGRPEARKPDDIQIVGIEARTEIDQIMARYRQQVDEILQSEGISPDTPPEVVLLATHKYGIQENAYDR